jgi:delta(3,5)-delta(2,4)-dienoyl-CoA isomerase
LKIPHSSWARELAFTARDFSAGEALKHGLNYFIDCLVDFYFVGFVSRIFNTKEECLNASFELAAQIASKSPIAVQGKNFLIQK